ncbi:hypothetical protein [Streptomyces qinzhouensis]|uniref:Uncharacterized protein n=1 Tax=Streptomyces qinzhouensis TaxID=2599401 RepID=A0A5B8JEL6_9ACTN|nr:hypothetical protein [Streptomyces qinzhouensis]QDY78684.1 hypothetical protein FQU76_21630 [Streptomyces qinzhouensis]
MTGGPVPAPDLMSEHCAYCERPVERTERNLLMLGFSASGARPSLYAHPECPAPRWRTPRRTS